MTTTAQHPEEATLAELRDLRSRVLALYRQEYASLEDYLQSERKRVVVAHSVAGNRRSARVESATDPANQSTSTCFAAAHLAAPEWPRVVVSSSYATPAPNPRAFVGEQNTTRLMRTIIADTHVQYRVVNGRLTASAKARNAKLVASLPNTYNTPIHLCGLVAAADYLGGVGELKDTTVGLGYSLATEIASWVLTHDGHIYDAEISEHREHQPGTTPNPYLSLWCVRSLTEWANLVSPTSTAGPAAGPATEYQELANKAVTLALESSIDRLSRMVVAHHTGIGSLYDAMDVVATVASVGLASRWLGRRDEFTEGIIGQSIDVLLDRYVHSDGSFAPKTPILTAKTGGFSLVASSTELAALLLHGVGRDLAPRHVLGLERVMANAQRRRSGPRGWGRGSKHSPQRRPAYAVCGALAFLRDYHAALDRHVARRCARELEVQPYAPDPQVRALEFPLSVKDGLSRHVVRPIREGRRDLAVMSFVLGGPPGTAKTTIAKKVAQELEWPILLLDQGSFLRKGSAVVESEAERIFDLLLELSDTVVLFDEIEEMMESRDVGEKAGRFLTTSMLPRIHRLRDQGRVIFIIATNHSARIDTAASRPGRIDATFEVEPPTPAERKEILERLIRGFGASSELERLFRAAGVVDRTDGFTFVYLRELVRSCVRHEAGGGKVTHEVVNKYLRDLDKRLQGEQPKGNADRGQ